MSALSSSFGFFHTCDKYRLGAFVVLAALAAAVALAAAAEVEAPVAKKGTTLQTTEHGMSIPAMNMARVLRRYRKELARQTRQHVRPQQRSSARYRL